MKKLLYILICLPLIFNSCEKEDAPVNSGSSNNTYELIVATWNASSITQAYSDGYFDPILATEVVDSLIPPYSEPWSSGDSSYTWTFTANGLFIEDSYADDTLYNSSPGTYAKDGNTIILNGGAILTITTLTDSALSLDYFDYSEWILNDTTYFQERITTRTLNK